MKRVLAIAGVFFAGFVIAQHAEKQGEMGHIMLTAEELKWGPAPPGLPAGAQIAVAQGDPSKAGYFTLRAKLPANYTVPPHWHPTDEQVTVLSGTMHMGSGAKIDKSTAKMLPPGGFAVVAAKQNHYVYTGDSEVIIQVSAMGPFEITYVNPSDDPRKKDGGSK